MVTISLDKIITVMESGTKFNKTYNMKYNQFNTLTKYSMITANMPHGTKDKRIKQFESIGFSVKEIAWDGIEVHSPTRIIFEKEIN